MRNVLQQERSSNWRMRNKNKRIPSQLHTLKCVSTLGVLDKPLSIMDTCHVARKMPLYEGRTESHEQHFFVKWHALLLTNQIHHLNLHNFLYFFT